MKYLLLRNNQESGPYTLGELSGMNLKPFDLLWQEGISTSWKYPGEIEELVPMIDHSAPFLPQEPVSSPKGIFVSLPKEYDRTASRRDAPEPQAAQFSFIPSSAVEKEEAAGPKEPEVIASFQENYRQPRKRELWQRHFLPAGQVFSVALVFIGAVLGAFVIKKIVDSFDPSLPGSTGNAVVISAPELPQSNDPDYRNALSREVIPVVDSTVKISPKPVKPRDIKKLVQLKGSDYKVGLLGGIKGLELSVHNGSNHLVERVVVVVEYLKPKGEVVQTEQYTIRNIKPFQSKALPIPSSDRGVKAQYRIVDISSKEYKRLLDKV